MIAVIRAMEDEVTPEIEFQGVEKRYVKYSRCSIREWRYQNQEILLVVSGPGKKRAEQALQLVLNHYSPKIILSVGNSGGMKPQLRSGDLMVCSSILAEGQQPIVPDPNLYSLAVQTLRERGVNFHTGIGLTTPNYAWLLEDREEIERKHPEASIIEMEDYWLGSIATINGIPFLTTRVVNEVFREVITPHQERSQDQQAEWEKRFKLVISTLTNDFLLPFLEQLRKSPGQSEAT